MSQSKQAPTIREGQFADVMPEMSDEEYNALKRSIERNGFDETTPIIVDSDGEIIDGHHRWKACQELDVEPAVVEVEEATPEQAYRSNLARRNLEGGKKRELVTQYLEEHWDGDRDQAEVAADLGVSPATVSRARRAISDEIPAREKRKKVRELHKEYPGAYDQDIVDKLDFEIGRSTVNEWRKEIREESTGSEDETADQQDIGSFRDSMEPDQGVHWDPSRCLAVTGAGGKQCNSRMTPICGNHEKSNSLVRVDEFPHSPNEDLREELMDHCEIDGKRAFGLAVLADDIEYVWQVVTGLEDVTVGPFEWSGSQLASWADKVAMHPEIDGDWNHPLAAQDCVALTGKGEQCPNGSYGTKLLCGMHADVDDPETVLERDGILEDLQEVSIEGQPHYVVEERGDDLVVITPVWEIERVPAAAATAEPAEPDEVEREDVSRDTDQAEAIDKIAHGAWDAEVIFQAFEVTGSVVSALEDRAYDVRDVMRWSNNLGGDLEELPDIGTKSAGRIQSVLTELEARGVSQHTLLVDPEEDDDDPVVSGPTETISGPDDSISGPSDDETDEPTTDDIEVEISYPDETDDDDDEGCIIDDWLDDWDEETPPGRVDWREREIPVTEENAWDDSEDDLLKTLEQIRGEREQLLDRIDELEDEIDRLEREQDPDEQRISKLVKRVNELEEENEELTQQSPSAEAEDYRSALQEAEEEIEQLEAELERAEGSDGEEVTDKLAHWDAYRDLEAELEAIQEDADVLDDQTGIARSELEGARELPDEPAWLVEIEQAAERIREEIQG